MCTNCFAELMQDGVIMISYNKSITNLKSPLIKACVNSGSLLVEGYGALSKAVTENIKVKTLLLCPDMFLGSNEAALIASIVHKNPDLVVCRCTEAVFKKISDQDCPDGLLAMTKTILSAEASVQRT